MPFRKKTLRQMTPTQRKLAKLLGEIDSIRTRLRNTIDDVGIYERFWGADHNRQKIKAQEAKPCPEHFGGPLVAGCRACDEFAFQGRRLTLEGRVFDKLPETGAAEVEVEGWDAGLGALQEGGKHGD